MDLGAFSISLAVKDLQVSKEFYLKLGFEQFAGSEDAHYLILKNGEHLIGLFEGMFENNILTFNPGWDQNAGSVEPFTDVREIQKQLISRGIKIDVPIEDSVAVDNVSNEGPANFVITDPDGNQILIDQHR